jgi:glycyl-tRNA synthetase beta chain
MAEYLLEIGTEEIPAKFMAGALQQMEETTGKALLEKHIAFESVKAMGTPRRLALIIRGLAEKGEDLTEEVRGPSRKAAFDAAGNPTKAVLGFAKGQGVEPAELIIKEVAGNEYVFAVRQVKGQATASVLPDMMQTMIQNLYFPKPMRWGDLEFRFARPIRWIVSMLNDQVLPFELAGVRAGNRTRGHRFLGSEDVVLSGASQYESELEAQYVMVDPARRQAEAWRQIQAVAEANQSVVEPDEELIEEVTYLIEWPTALMGSFKETYLEIPEEVVITPMREHQRYFPVRDKQGKLMNRFVTVRNGGSRCLDVVQAGNEKVLAARLADARFFWDEDRKQPLEAGLHRLDKVVFQERLGTIGYKVARIEELTAYLADALAVSDEVKADARRAAHLAKADLVTNMVCEFTELQGIMGRYYALESGEKPSVAQAILEHYQPRFAGDAAASSQAGALVAIADKLDSIAGIFAIGIEPTGSQDPYALRRAAMGICQTILARALELDVDKLISKALDQYGFVMEKDSKPVIAAKIKEFFAARLRNILSDAGHRYDVVEAAMAVDWQQMQAVVRRAEALTALRDDPHFVKLLAVFTRANNLAKKGGSWIIDPSALTEPCEKELYASVMQARESIEKTQQEAGLQGVIRLLSSLAEPINAFFDGVMVMAEDETVRAARLALLNAVVEMSRTVGDLSKLCD